MNLRPIDKKSAKPIYLQIRDELLAAIERREIQPDECIPSTRQISGQTGASRMTVLQALREMVHEGRLYTVPGKGTFVARNIKLEPKVDTVWGFTDSLRAQGFNASSELLSLDRIQADEKIAANLEIRPSDPVYRLMRRRLLDGHPAGVEIAYLPAIRFPGLENFNWQVSSLYEVLRNHYKTVPASGDQYVEAGSSGEQISRWLQIPRKSPILIMDRITRDYENRIIEHVTAYYSSDHLRLKVKMTGEGPVNIVKS